MELKLGNKITFNKVLKRRDEYKGNRTKRKFWEAKSFKETQGIIIGRRTLSNGEAHHDSESGWLYEGKEFFTAYLVVYHLNKKPVLIIIDQSNLNK